MAYNIKADKNPMSINILKLQRYNFNFFKLDEVVFFEYIIVKAQAFGFGQFYHSTATIEKETGLKRHKLDSIIAKFKKLGILNIELKGFPTVKHFTVNFTIIKSLLPQIFQVAENGKLNAEITQVLGDFYNPMVEKYIQKNNLKETTKVLLIEKKERESGWFDFSLLFYQKMKIYKAEFSLTDLAIKFDDQQLYDTYKTYGDDTHTYFYDFLKINTFHSKVSNFLKPDKLMASKNAFIENFIIQEKLDGKKLITSLSKLFNDRRTMASDAKKKFSQTGLISNDALATKAAQVLKQIGENEINHAFIAYADAIINDKVQPRKILPYFFTWQYGSYSVIEEYLNIFNVRYSITTK